MMFLISFILVNITFVLIISIYCKLTCGICKCSKHLVGKVVIVTGGNAGIGYETAKDLADRGARVILACRSEERGTTARDKIINTTGNTNVHFRQLDLSSFSSVRKFADDIIKSEKRLDILINNAGVFEFENVKTDDGLFVGMQTNHFGPFLLTSLLLPLLKSSAPSRIINVSSVGYRSGEIDFENLNMEKETAKSFSSLKAYQNSKLCNVHMTVELDRLLKGTGVTANSLHPGWVETEIIKSIETTWLKYIAPFGRLFTKNCWEGAQTTIYLAVAPELENVSGSYFVDCRVQDLTAKAHDAAVSRKLWEVSERVVKLT